MEQVEPLGPEVWKVLSVAVLGSFLAQVDATVVNVSLSSLATDLHTTLTTIQWVTSGYLLALALMLPLNAWLVERIGAKRLYLVCFTGFTLTSALCGASWSAESLIGFRVLQGMCGGLMAPMAQLMMARAAGRQMVRVMGIATIPILLGPLLGPVIAGAILQHTSWRWLFLVNLPVGALALVLAWMFLPADNGAAGKARSLDVGGLLLLSPGLVLFLYGSDHVRERVGIGAMLLAVVLLAAFYRKATKDGARALIDIELFRNRIFSAAAVTQFTTNGLSFAGQMLIPLYLIRAAGKSPSTTGWLMAPMGLGMMLTYPSLGRVTKWLGMRRTSITGAMLALTGSLGLVCLSVHGFALWLLVPALFVRGMGSSAVGVPTISAAYASVKKDELPMATTALNIAQRLGGPTLTTVCATFLGWRLAAATASHSGVAHAFTMAFVLLCCLQATLVVAVSRMPRTIATAQQ